MYYPLRNACGSMTAKTGERVSHYAIEVEHSDHSPGTDRLGTSAGDLGGDGRDLWRYEQRSATMSLLATGGGLLFGGDVNGRFRAFDQETGEILWEVPLGSPVTSFPITYSVGGRQYVAVGTGSAATASGFRNLTPELQPAEGNNFFVFALPETR